MADKRNHSRARTLHSTSPPGTAHSLTFSRSSLFLCTVLTYSRSRSTALYLPRVFPSAGQASSEPLCSRQPTVCTRRRFGVAPALFWSVLMRSTAWAEHSLCVVGHQKLGRVEPVVLFPDCAAIPDPSCGSRRGRQRHGLWHGREVRGCRGSKGRGPSTKACGGGTRPPPPLGCRAPPCRTRAAPPPPTGTIKRNLGSTADFDYGQFGPVLYKGPNAHAARATRRIWWPRPTWSRCRVCPAPAPSPSCPRPAGRLPTRPNGRYRRGGNPRRSRRRRHG
eukprot:scaffold19802_cov112-Isochrysis_galbana.AAC.3